MRKLIFILLALPLFFAACDDDETETMVIDSSLPQGELEVVSMGQFVAQSSTSTSGLVQLGIDTEDDSFVRLSENFMTELGTGTVTVYLSTTNDLGSQFNAGAGNPNLQLVGIVQRNGEHFFKLNSSIDPKFEYVVLWCASAGVPFGNAELM